MFFGLENQDIDMSDVKFTVKIDSLVEQNNAMEAKLNSHVKSAPWRDEESKTEEDEPEITGSECLRKAKLSN